MSNRYAAFISYANRYTPWVRVLQRNLERCLAAAGRPGEVFLDQTDLGSGHSWVTQLQSGIDRCEHFILVATPEALASPRVGDEWEGFVAKRREWSTTGRFHVVDLLEVPLPSFLSRIQRVDFRNAGEVKYRLALSELVAGLLGHSDRRNLPALPEDVEVPSPPDSGLDPRLRSRLVNWLTPVLASKAYRKAIASELQLKSAVFEGQPSSECAASALLVWATGDEEPIAAAVRIIETLRETLEEDEPERVAELVSLRADLVARQKEAPERGLLEIWLAQVVSDHERLVPYFQQQAEIGLLERVYVKLELRSEEGRHLDQSVLGSDAPLPGRPLGLREVLALSREGNPWISGRWIVLGDPGAGKTTLLRHLTATLARQVNRPWIPIFESVPRLLRENDSLLDRVVRRMERAGHPAQELAATLNHEGKDGRLLLLLDGLDEVPRNDLEDAEKLLRGFAIRWPTTPIVVTSRRIGYRPPGANFRELRLLPLDRERRREFLARWLCRVAGKPDEARAESALVVLDAPELRDLAGNPLYLTLMALLFEQEAEPARHRTKLYDQVLSFLLEGKHRPEGQPMERQEAVRAAIRCLALGMTEDNRDAESVAGLDTRLYGEEMDEERRQLERVPRWRDRMRRFLDDLSEQTGILGPHDGPDSDWRFWHRSFREALTAERLETQYRAEGGKEAVLARAHTLTREEDLSAWAEPFALLAGRLEAPDELVKDLVKINPALGLRSLATAQSLAPGTVHEILELSESWAERAEVYESIPKLVGEPRRALALLDQVRKRTTNGNDLFFLDRVMRKVGGQFPNHSQEAAELAERLYDHLPKPDEELFRWIETPKNGRIPLWCQIPAGETWIGSAGNEGYDREKPRHRVKIERPFALSAVTVTNAQFRAFDPSRTPSWWNTALPEEFPFYPVFKITWHEAVSFCRWLASLFPWARGARLPLEEEWEHGCRAGSETRYWSGDKDQDLERVGWYRENSMNRTHRVGEKEANPWGLYDVHGNILEWTLSAFKGNYEGGASALDPVTVDLEEIAREGGGDPKRVLRGGSAWLDAVGARLAHRYYAAPGHEVGGQGFRVAIPTFPGWLEDGSTSR